MGEVRHCQCGSHDNTWTDHAFRNVLGMLEVHALNGCYQMPVDPWVPRKDGKRVNVEDTYRRAMKQFPNTMKYLANKR